MNKNKISMEPATEYDAPRRVSRTSRRNCRAIHLAKQAGKQGRELQRLLGYLQSELRHCTDCQRAVEAGAGASAGCTRLERYLQQTEAVILDLYESWMG
jgi:recombinational DNA repair protein RecR